MREAPGPDPRLRGFTVERDGRPASFAEVIDGLRHDVSLCEALGAALAALPFAAFKWETPGVTAASAERPFACVALDAPELARTPDPEAFAEWYDPQEPLATFPNLSGDAVLVAPRPLAPASPYAHLADFLRHAPDDQRHALWQAVGAAMTERLEGSLGRRPVWLSTAGEGVAWLHVRLDDAPKYYGHAPYRASP